MDLTAHQGFFTHFRLRLSLGGAGERGGLVVEDPFGKPYQSRTNGPINAHLTIAQV